MEVLTNLPLFPDIQANDPTYLAFMQDIRSEMSSVVTSRCESFCFNFLKDQPFESEAQIRFEWEYVKPGGEELPGDFAYQGRTSLASMETYSTFPTGELESEGQIPEISFAAVGRTSLTNEDFVNALPELPEDPEEEEDEGSVHHMPYHSAHTSSGLPFGRQV